MRRLYHSLLAVLLAFATAQAVSATARTTEFRDWIVEMKTSRKGPFVSIRWYCKDGEILPPEPYACKPHGGGHQHGKLGRKALILRQHGYWIANILAGFDARKQLTDPDFIDWYNQLLIEKFLITADRGWILRRVPYYRGAIQEEDERAGARTLLTALAGRPEWVGLRYPALRIGVQLLPHGEDTASIQKIRQLSTALAEQDEKFNELRTKIHAAPDAADAGRVRDYAQQIDDPQLQKEYLQLAGAIDRVFRSLPQLLAQNAKLFRRSLALGTTALCPDKFCLGSQRYSSFQRQRQPARRPS